MIKLVIFDFDGTIVNSKFIYYETIARYLEPLGFSTRNINSTIELGMNLNETLKRFVPSRLYRWWIKRKIIHDVNKYIKNVQKCHDVSHIRDIHIKKILISNSYSEFVLPVLNHLKVKRYFSEVYCANKFNDKEKFIEKYLKFHRLKPKEVFYVGDRVADVRLAKEAGLHNIIISGRCAWDSKKELLKAKPEFIVPDLIFVKRIVENCKE